MKKSKLIAGKGLFALNKIVKNDLINFTSRMVLENLPLVRIKLIKKELYITADADMAAAIMVKETEKFNRGLHYERIKMIGGTGLITSEGEYWKKQRRTAQPGFHRDRVNGFLDTFIQLSYEVDDRWDAVGSQELKMTNEMSSFTLKAASLTLFSANVTKNYPAFRTHLKYILRFFSRRQYEIIRFPISWPLLKNIKFKKGLKYLNKAVYSYIDKRMASEERIPDLLDMFLVQTDEKTGEGLTRLQIRDEFLTILVAGYETSSIALTWFWYVLDKHPDIAEKLRTELDEVIGEDRVKPEHLSRLEYTKKVVQESMRLYPPIFAIPRSIEKDSELNGYEIEGGQPILISVYAMNRNPAYWDNPEVFDPENFSEEKKAARHKHAYLPFGTGQRICIGSEFAMYEILAMIAVLARKYRPKPRPGYTPKMTASTTTDINEGMPMTLNKV